jgi:flagellar hook-associated protein 1 FlgK
MSTGLLGIGSSALNAAYTALRTTGNNIANASTAGYSREITTFEPTVQTPAGGGMYIGTGVDVTAISRVYSDFLGQQTNLAQAQASQADTTATLTQQINSLFSSTTSGIGTSIDNFFTQLQTLSQAPNSSAARTTTLSAAKEMTSQFNDAQAQLETMSQSATQQLSEQIQTVNQTVSQIASLNSQIAVQQASGNTPNTLLDERDQAILTLNQSIGVTTNSQSDGEVNVYLANGQPLLVGSQTFALTMGTDPTNSQNTIVGTSSGGSIVPIDPNNSGGGSIGALLQFQSDTIPSVENQIGQLAVSLASQFNSIQEAGTDQSGAAGQAMFSTPTIATTAASTNTDAGTVSLTASFSNTSQVQASNYQVKVEGGNYVVTRLSDGTQTTFTSMPATIDGMTLNFSGGTPANGDIFNVSPVQDAASTMSVNLTQGSQIAAGSALEATTGSSNTGSLTVGNLALQALPNNPNANLNNTVVLNFTSPTSYTYTTGGVTSAAQTYTAGQAINVNGWSLTLSGTPASGDSVTVAATGSGTGDNRNVQLMTQLQNQGIVGGQTLDSAYSAVVGSVGAIASTANTDQTSKDAILSSATSNESSVSGVNLDEEATNLMQYQQQYQAAAQLINASNTIFNALITDINATG